MSVLGIKTDSKVIQGEGSLVRVFDELPDGTRNVTMVTGKHFRTSHQYHQMAELFKNRGIQLNTFVVEPEPTSDVIDEITGTLTTPQDLVIGIGGGSALDAAKAVAVMLTSEGSTERYLESVGDLEAQPRQVPFFAIPTTSGTGSEATKNAVFIKPGKVSHKKSIRHDSYIPDIVVLDPLLMLSCPAEVTAACGFDAIAQLLEAYISVKATSYTDKACLKGLETAFEVFPAVCNELAGEPWAREKMAEASYLSGVGLANAGLVNIHGIAGPIGGEIAIPHGVAVAMIFPETLKLIIEKLPQDSVALNKLNQVGNLVQSDSGMEQLSGSQRLVHFLTETKDAYLGDSLTTYSMTHENIMRIAKESDDKNSPVNLSEEDIVGILNASVLHRGIE